MPVSTNTTTLCCCNRCVRIFGVVYTFGLFLRFALATWPSVASEQFNLLPGINTTVACITAGTAFRPTDLETRGYAVYPNFLTAQEVQNLVAIYERLPNLQLQHNRGDSVGFKFPHHFGVNIFEAVPDLLPAILRLTGAIQADTDIHITDNLNTITSVYEPEMLHTNAGIPGSMMFGWHQDHESYFFHQDTYNYLNFYIMLAKEHPREAGIEIVPFDILCNHSPSTCNFLRSRGATTIDSLQHAACLVDDDTDTMHFLAFDLESMSCTPELYPGDLLILRGDTVHRTQPHRSWRTSVSIRVSKPFWEIKFDFGKFMTGGLNKYRYMYARTAVYAHGAQTLFSSNASTAARQLVYVFAFLGIKIGFWVRVFLSPLRVALFNLKMG